MEKVKFKSTMVTNSNVPNTTRHCEQEGKRYKLPRPQSRGVYEHQFHSGSHYESLETLPVSHSNSLHSESKKSELLLSLSCSN